MKKLGKVFILGDSYSTFKGCNPQSYTHYYDENSRDLFGFNDKEHTWWSLLLKRTGGVLVVYKFYAAFSRIRTNLNLPQSRRLCTFRQILARCIDIHSRSPLPKIIKNGNFEVASEFNGKKAIKTRQSSEVVLFCTMSENNAVFSEFFTVKSSLSSFSFG